MSNIPPDIAPVVIPGDLLTYRQVSDVVPFSYRSSVTYASLLEGLRDYLINSFVPWTHDEFAQFGTSFAENYATLIETVNAALAAQAGTVNTALDTEHTTIDQALLTQQQTIQQELSDQMAAVNLALGNAISQLAGGSLEVVDPAIWLAINNPISTSRALLDTLYGAKSVVDGLTELVNTGRLSQTSLDSAYTVTDAEVAAQVNAPGSLTRAAFDALYERIEFQSNNGYIQFRYIGDTVWQNVIALTDLMGSPGQAGPQGDPGGVAELAYAESLSTFSVPTTTPGSNVDVPGLTLSFVMPSRPVLLKIGAIVRNTTTANDSVLRLIETTGGGSTVIHEVHCGVSATSVDYQETYQERRITGTAGVTRTFKLQAVMRSAAWDITAATAFPTFIGAYKC